MTPRKTHFKRIILYVCAAVALVAPMALVIPNLGYDLLRNMTAIHVAVIVASPVIAGALILFRILWYSGRD